ncbi:MAG: divergent polysaccharide deacetylase family protein [Pseudomonadota bacterium]
MRALKITSISILIFFLGLIAWVILQSDPMGGEPVFVVELDHQQKLAVQKFGSAPNTDQAKIKPLPDVFKKSKQNNDQQRNTKHTMSPVPVQALLEFSQFGPLPKISTDGRKPSEVYARPFNLPPRPGPGEPTRIAIVMTGLGLSANSSHSAIHNLPGAVTLAFSPYGQNLQGWIKKARELGHEIILQVPFEPYDYPDNDPGPHTLLTGLPPNENLKRLKWIMSRMTGYVGITNKMGAKFSTAENALKPILMELGRRGLYYFDNGEAPRSIAGKLANQTNVGFSKSHLTIDLAPMAQDIDAQLLKLEEIAGEKGLAIGIGTTLPLTIERIKKWAKTLEQKNAILVPISAAIRSAQGS